MAKKYSNNMKDAVCTSCQICGKVFKFVAMRGHTKKNHGLTIMAYRERYGKLVPLEEIFHKCGLCGHEMILDSDNVMIHLKNSHNITHANYNAEFMVTARGRPKVERQGVPGVPDVPGVPGVLGVPGVPGVPDIHGARGFSANTIKFVIHVEPILPIFS